MHNFSAAVPRVMPRILPPLTVAFFGLPLGALCLLRDGFAVAPITLSPVRAPGRQRLVRALGTSQILDAGELGSDLDAAVETRLRATRPDLLVSWFWTRRLPSEWLGLARLGGINAHPSLLPRHRGPDPYFWAIESGDELSGATVHQLTAEYDTGDILLQEAISVGERNAWQLARALDRPALRLLREAVRRYATGRPPAATPQDAALATPAPAPSGELLRVDWRWPTVRILRRIRALSPTPGLALEIAGLPFFVTQAHAAERPGAPLEPGEAVVGEALTILTGDQAIAVDRALIGAGDELDEGLEVDGRTLARRVAERLAREGMIAPVSS